MPNCISKTHYCINPECLTVSISSDPFAPRALVPPHPRRTDPQSQATFVSPSGLEAPRPSAASRSAAGGEGVHHHRLHRNGHRHPGELQFKLVPLVKPPRTFSKLRLINALTTRNLWPAVRDWLDASGYYDIFLAAQDFREDHPQFAAALTAAQSRFGLTDAETAAILAESVIQ